jgi:hypothetical protein
MELAQVSNDYATAAVVLEEHINELTATQTNLESALSLQTQALETTRQQLEITTHSSSLKLGLFLSWPFRHLRISKRTT